MMYLVKQSLRCFSTPPLFSTTIRSLSTIPPPPLSAPSDRPESTITPPLLTPSDRPESTPSKKTGSRSTINPDSRFSISNVNVPVDREKQMLSAEDLLKYLVPENTPRIENLEFYGRNKKENSILNVELDCPEATKLVIQRRERLRDNKDYKTVFLHPHVENWKSMSKTERIDADLYRVDPRKRVFIQNLPLATNNGEEETEEELKKSVESLFSNWKKIPNILNVSRVGHPNAHGRKPVQVTLETEEDAALILQKDKKLVHFKGRDLHLHVSGYKKIN